MRTVKYIFLLSIFSTLLISAACGQSEAMTTQLSNTTTAVIQSSSPQTSSTPTTNSSITSTPTTAQTEATRQTRTGAATGIMPATFAGLQKITAEELNAILVRDEWAMQVVDVRDVADFTPAHIPHAKSIPIKYNASGQIDMNDSIKNQLLSLPKDVPLIFYGYGIIENDKDAALMAQALADFKEGFTDIRVLIKGHDRWVELGYTTVETGG